MDTAKLAYKLGQFNMTANMLRQMLRQIDATQNEEFFAVFELLDDLCETSELDNL